MSNLTTLQIAHKRFAPRLWIIIAAAVGLCLLVSAPAAAERVVKPVAMSMLKGQSHVLEYADMRRVAVADPHVADVAVASSCQVIVYAIGVGKTAVYVWDDSGFHQIGISVFDITPSEMAVERLRPLLGGEYRFVVLSDSMLGIEGVAEDTAEAARLDRVLASAGDDVKVINLVTLAPEPPPAGPPVEQIAGALGGDYHVWSVNHETVAVEGTASTPVEAARARALIAAFKPQTNVVDLIREPEAPARSIDHERELIADAVGDGVHVRTVGGQAIALEGTLPAEADVERVAQIIETLDVAAPVLNLVTAAAPDQQQVLVRVKVAEINTQALEQLGVNWGHTESGGGTPSVSFFDQPFLFGQVARKGFNQLLDFGAQLNLLVEDDRARILAEPNLLVNDGEEASILVGGEVPIPVPQAGMAGAAAITIEYKEFGVRMQVTPSILPEAGDAPKIHLALAPEVSSIDPSSSVTVSGLKVPGFRTRRAETTVTVAPGDTLAIAGLLQSETAKTIRKIPILGDIPIIGNLFRSKRFTEGKTDLVIMVTPEIHESAEE
ncbi:MAG: pilus assembly protein N-terminal domain-containing protein [Armatimonadota bacterium]|jgi:Flp pilus assembly secretin CpaC